MPGGVRQALVFGGTGYVGEAVVRELRKAGLPTVFTFHRQRERAQALGSETGATARPLDVRDAAAIRALIDSLPQPPDVFVHCVAVSRAKKLGDLSDADFDEAHAVNVRSAFVACSALAPRLVAGGDLVLLSGLHAGQSATVPVHFASTQGALAALAMALSKELGPKGTRINVLALGLLEGGLSRDINPELAQDYRAFSALRRLGTAAEAAKAARWLALENTYMNGRVVTVNGGL